MLEHEPKLKPFWSVGKGVYTLKATSKGAAKSNLKKLANMMGASYDINGSICTLMRVLVWNLGFVIGPPTHRWYKVYAKAADYENDELRLYHPDIKSGFATAKRSMRGLVQMQR